LTAAHSSAKAVKKWELFGAKLALKNRHAGCDPGPIVVSTANVSPVDASPGRCHYLEQRLPLETP
jgi:hypothetical protein